MKCEEKDRYDTVQQDRRAWHDFAEGVSLDYSSYEESERQSVDRGGTLYPR